MTSGGAEVLTEGTGHSEWMVEGDSYKYHLLPLDQLQKEGL